MLWRHCEELEEKDNGKTTNYPKIKKDEPPHHKDGRCNKRKLLTANVDTSLCMHKLHTSCKALHEGNVTGTDGALSPNIKEDMKAIEEEVNPHVITTCSNTLPHYGRISGIGTMMDITEDDMLHQFGRDDSDSTILK